MLDFTVPPFYQMSEPQRFLQIYVEGWLFTVGHSVSALTDHTHFEKHFYICYIKYLGIWKTNNYILTEKINLLEY
jgi:hypothetical protein